MNQRTDGQGTDSAASRARVTRRAALKIGTIGLAAAVHGAAETGRDGDGRYGPLKVGVHTYSLRGFGLADAVRITKELGVRYIGLNPVHLPLDSSPAACAEAKRHIEEAGLTLLACGVVKFSRSEKKARQAFDYARTMGMGTIVANPLPESFDVLDRLVEEYGIRIAIHNHGPGGLYSVPQDTLEALKDHHEAIGACVDLGHYERSGVKAHEALRALSDRLYDVHLKDVNQRDKDGHSVVMGEGVVDFPAVVDALLEARFNGHVALEYEQQPENPQPSMAESFAYFQRVVSDRLHL